MFASVAHGAICASCRLRAVIVSKQLARSRGTPAVRHLSTTQAWRFPRSRPRWSVAAPVDESAAITSFEGLELSVEERALQARQEFGDALPKGYLSGEESRVYERLCGTPLQGSQDDGGLDGGKVDDTPGTGVLKLADDGALEEIEFEDESAEKPRKAKRMGVGEQWPDEDDAKLAEDIRFSNYDGVEDADTEEVGDPTTQRTHPLTLANRFGTSPLTIQLPKPAFVDPTTTLLSGISNTHLAEAAHRIFGGVGLPYSTSTPALGKIMQAKPIALDAYQERMSEMDGDVYMATLMPGIFASVTSVLAETRKRLGSAWAKEMVRKAEAGELRILDAGGGGAGVLAVREVLRAEWERMHEDAEVGSPVAVAEADGRVGVAGASPPLGRATVLTGSDALRKRASRLLVDTSFIPRLPDYAHTETAKQKGKFDIIVAPHTLWPLREDYVRRGHTQNLWSLLNADGGVLLLLEKGVARGFELVAAARELLLDTRISSPDSRAQNLDIHDPQPDPHVNWDGDPSSLEPEPLTRQKEKGMIIAPCTNHAGCPMYVQKGMVKGRKDVCHFEQRYVRPGFLQRVLGAKDKNFEDVRFSYLAVVRGRDLRDAVAEGDQEGSGAEGSEGPGGKVVQGMEATDAAFVGFEDVRAAGGEGREAVLDVDRTGDVATPHSLSLPRAILPPLKRRGHVILDLCTPAGTLERWTVPRSYSKQAFRDARKSRWGDLWALGAKTRVLRTVRKNKHDKPAADITIDGRAAKKAKSGKKRDGAEFGIDEYGHVVVGRDMGPPGDGGKVRTGRKVGGIRDKRDKKGRGNGRRKYQVEE